MKHRRLFASAPSALALAFLGTGALSAAAQGGGGPPVMAELPLRSIGPAVMSGRVSDLAVVPGRPWEFYVGTASGGLFRTRNNGATWDPLFDHFGTTSIGAVALSPSDPATVWVGTGEPANRQSSSFGDGVYVLPRWRGLVPPPGPRSERAHRPDRGGPRPSAPRLRGGARAAVALGRRARGVPHRRRRRELGAGAGDLRRHRRGGPRDGSPQSGDPLRGGLHPAPDSLGLQRRRPRGRHLPQPGRRRQLGAARRRPSRRPGGADRSRNRRLRPPQRVRARRTRNRVRSVAFPRPGGDLGADFRPEPAPHVLLAHRSGSGRHPPGLCARVAIPCLGRRGAHFPGEPGHDAHLRHRRPRGPPRAVRGPGRRLAPAAGRRRRDLRVVGPGGSPGGSSTTSRSPSSTRSRWTWSSPTTSTAARRTRIPGWGPPPRGTRPAS